MRFHWSLRGTAFLSIFFLTMVETSQATRHKFNVAKGNYGATPTDEIAQAMPTSGFTIDPGTPTAGIEIFDATGTKELFAVKSSVRCVTQASNCGTANTFYAYFYFVTVKSTITTPFQITIPGPYDLHNNPNLDFGVIGQVDTSGSNNPVSTIAACTNANASTQTSCIDSVLGNASGVTPAGITYEIDPTGLINTTGTQQLAAGDLLILFITSFNPPSGCKIDVLPPPASLSSLSPCAGQSSAAPALGASGSSTPLSPANLPVFGPAPLSAGRRPNTMSGYFAQGVGSLQTQSNITLTNGAVSLTVSPAVQALGSSKGPPNNVSYVYTYGITVNATNSQTFSLSFMAPYNESNSGELHFGLIQDQDLAGNATNVQSCSGAASLANCLEDILNTTGLPTSSPLQLNLDGSKLTAGDYIPLFAITNNPPNCAIGVAGALTNCQASAPFTVSVGATPLTPSSTTTLGPTAARAGDFDGDGKADKGVFRPSSGLWFAIPSSSPSSFILQQWGMQGDVPVLGDYDGDGIDDVAVFRPSNGLWFIIPSSNPSSPIIQQWGMNGDIPVPGDYDGDGKTDFAVFRPSNGLWFIIPSSNPTSTIIRQWGTSGDIPVPGDYDGDGKTDIAVWRPSTGTWWITTSGTPSVLIIEQWGASGDMPVPGDYDGDGKTDIAVWRPSDGVWFIIPSSNPSTPILRQWGTSGDIPVPVDYDGDRKTDIAVWRPSSGNWFIIPSSAPSTFTVTQWGSSGDVPVQKPIGQ